MHDDQLRDLLRTLEDGRDPDPSFADALFTRLSIVRRNERRSRTPLVLLAAAVLLAVLGTGFVIGSGLVRFPNLVVDASSSPSPSATESAIAEASPSVSPAPSDSAVPSDPASTAFEPDSLVRTIVDALIIRADAGLGGDRLGTLANGATSMVVDGPVPADGYDWYLMSALGLPPASGCGPGQESTEPYTCPMWFGWVAAAAPDGAQWLTQASVDCVEPPAGELVELTANHPHFEMLHCYGGRDLTFRAWWPEQATEASWYCDADADIGWLGCPSVVLGWDPGYWEAIGVAVHPENGPQFPERGQWISVTAHLDDAEAVHCGTAADPTTADLKSILGCRAHLVVTAVESVPAP